METIDADTIKEVFKNMENQTNFVLRENDDHFEYL